MPRGNPSPKLAITVDPEVHRNILAAAARDGVSVSAWMTGAAREALRRRALRQKAMILTSDPDDIERLVRASGREVAIVTV
jgi:hypothetical protein